MCQKIISDNVTAVLISSPSPSHPSTTLIDSVIDSFSNINQLSTCRVIIVFDGYEVRENHEMKKGKVTSTMAENYELNILAIKEKYNDTDQYHIHKSDTHRGFALCVKLGLELCKTQYAMIVQHDRIFLPPPSSSRPTSSGSSSNNAQPPSLFDLIHLMETHTHTRYIGYPTHTSCSHAAQLLDRYYISCYTSYNTARIPITNTLYFLQPLTFWFDSNHFIHIQRYLEIYQPFINITDELKCILGSNGVKRLLLRRGDFIEVS